MRSRTVFLSCLLSLSLGAALLVTPKEVAAFQCEAQVMKALETVNMTKSDMDSVKVMKYPNPVGGGQSCCNYTWEAWIRTKECSNGFVVVHLSRSCAFKQMYTQGNCQMSGMPDY